MWPSDRYDVVESPSFAAVRRTIHAADMFGNSTQARSAAGSALAWSPARCSMPPILERVAFDHQCSRCTGAPSGIVAIVKPQHARFALP